MKETDIRFRRQESWGETTLLPFPTPHPLKDHATCMSSHSHKKQSPTQALAPSSQHERPLHHPFPISEGLEALNPLSAFELGMGMEAARSVLTLPDETVGRWAEGLDAAKKGITRWWSTESSEEEKQQLTQESGKDKSGGFAGEWLSELWDTEKSAAEQVSEVADVTSSAASPDEGQTKDIAGIVLFPDYPIGIGDQPAHKYLKGAGIPLPSKIGGLGHAGLFAVNTKTGLTRYAEFGRYSDKKAKTPGVARRKRIPDMDAYEDGHKGLPTPDMLQPVLASISAQAGQKGRAEIYLVEGIDFSAVDSFISGSIGANHKANKPAYDILDNSCMTYALEGIAAGGDATLRDNTYDPRPAGHNPWENWYSRAEYDPQTGTQYTQMETKK